MSCEIRRIVAVLISVMFVFSGAFGFLAEYGAVYADVGSISSGEDIAYDKDGGVLRSMGFDTSKMPDTYDPDATTNPYGSDVATLNEVDEALFFDLSNSDDQNKSYLYGHNKKLNGSFFDFKDNPRTNPLPFLRMYDFVNAVKCDINGDGRDSEVAIVYTHYNYIYRPEEREIYMCLYDPVSGTYSNSVKISKLSANRPSYNFQVQSLLQITAGDFDKDSIDEIAVYSPGETAGARDKVMVFDLPEGKECENPYDIDSWEHAWNYMLPYNNEKVVYLLQNRGKDYPVLSNIYNNIDLTSGDADNDGIDDLIVSYGASDTDYYSKILNSDQSITRSIPSRSVLLYGSDSGQMLRDSQNISYGGQDLIRVSFAFGDVDEDGNEDMFIAGQLRSEQKENKSRVIGRYIYDKDSSEMDLESIQNMYVISGSMISTDEEGSEETFVSSNGWDENYYSSPLMKTNFAVGNISGSAGDVRIYLDSVLYTYDGGTYEIADELEDDSEDEDGNLKGSGVFAGANAFKKVNSDMVCTYYEFGAECANFTASLADYLLVTRVSTRRSLSALPSDYTEADIQTISSMLFGEGNGSKDLARYDFDHAPAMVGDHFQGLPFFVIPADTDKDGLIAEYTGEHNIQYQDPAVLAVLASPPYFKDVAAFDNNDLLVYLNTEYGSGSGSTEGFEDSYSSNFGVFINMEHGTTANHFIGNVSSGWAREETWGWEKERTFEMSYETEGGEDAVVMYSVPTENYIYKVKGVTVDDDGNYEEFTNTMTVVKPHKPVTQTLALEDYEEIQERYSDKLPDISKYLTSTPGDPASYPSSQNDLSDEAKSHIDWDSEHPVDFGEKWAGTAFGDGSVSQTISYSKEERDRYDNHLDGAFLDTEIGYGSEHEGWIWFHSFETGATFSFDRVWGDVASSIEEADCSATLKNMPRSAKGYGYGFSWKLFKYNIKDKGCTFPIVTYIVADVTAPPVLPDTIEQDFEKSSDSEIVLTWNYSHGNPQAFDIYRYEEFPIGGGDKLIGTVSGSDYKILKDEDGNTLRDKDGHVIRGYSFTDKDLTADTKYQYRMKVRTAKLPGESIFSPVIEARTDVSTKPDISLTTDELTIYPDSTYNVKAVLADPENYQSNISYQWQKYNTKKRKWEDMEGCDKNTLHFFNCSPEDVGTYRCRVNLIRKVESHPQYISTFTESCDVRFSLRSVKFGDIQVFEGKGDSRTNTGIYVNVSNTSSASLEKPTGMVIFNIEGPNGTIKVAGKIDEETGDVTINSIEDLIEDLGSSAFVDGGYLVTCSYEGSAIFYPAKDPEEYHYLRNIGESMFLSLQSSYYFGDDLAETMGLFDYKMSVSGKINRKDYTDRITKVNIYKTDSEGVHKTGDPVASYDMTKEDAKAVLPLNKNLAKRAYVEVYTGVSSEAAASRVIVTSKIPVQIAIKDKITGKGSLLKPLASSDLELSGGIDPDEENIETDDGNKSLSDFLLFRYYEQNGDYICDSDNFKPEEFIPASYYATVQLKSDSSEARDDTSWFYTPVYKGGKFMVVSNYYLISAGPDDKSAGRVRMISPDKKTDFTDEGYVGGTRITLKADPNPGYEISKWVVDDCGTRKTYPGEETFTFTVRSQNTVGDGKVKITAVMKTKNNRLKIGQKGEGKVSVSPEIVNGDNVLAGTKLKFKAEPEEGWRFEEWRFTSLGGDNIVSEGVTDEEGNSTKEFTMPDSSAEVHALFARNTVDVLAAEGLEVLFVNNGGDPYHEKGEVVATERGKNVPRGAEVIVRTKKGTVLAPNADFKVSVTDSEGIVQIVPVPIMSQGRDACTFKLPDDAESCIVSAETAKGVFVVYAEGDGVDFQISVDGTVKDGKEVEGIVSGSQVDIKATPKVRGKRISGWIINGEEKKTYDPIYTFNIVENMDIVAVMEPVSDYDMKISTEGGGTLEYIVSDPEGKEYDPVYVQPTGIDYKADVYQDESILFKASDKEADYTLTSLEVNGENKELDEGTFKVTQVDGDLDVKATFSPNVYFQVEMDTKFRDKRSLVLDDSYGEISNGEIIPAAKNRDFSFSVVVPDDSDIYVWAADPAKDPSEYDGNDSILPKSRKVYKDDLWIYYYKVENIQSDVRIVVSDHYTFYIRTPKQFEEYIRRAKSGSSQGKQTDGVLMNDIDMQDIDIGQLDNDMRLRDMYASFDGNGHTIQNLRLSAKAAERGFWGLFGTIHEGAEVRDVVFSNATLDGSYNCGLLADKNYGTISGVSIIGSSITVKEDCVRAGIAYENLGTIENCMIRDLTFINASGSTVTGGVVYNGPAPESGEASDASNASMTGNYFENVSTETGIMESSIVALGGDPDPNKGSFASNYYLQTYEAKDPHGTSVFSVTDVPSDKEKAEAEVKTAEFARKFAYMLNREIGRDVYGVSADDPVDNHIYILNRKDGNYVAPVRVIYLSGKTVTKYVAPGENELPGQADFGNNTPVAWEAGDRAYPPGDKLDIQSDMRIVGLGTDDFEEYTAKLSRSDGSGTHLSTVYYKDMDEAIQDAADNLPSIGVQQIDIIGNAKLTGDSITVHETTTVTVNKGASLTISNGLQINNLGKINVKNGSTVHKYGSLLNDGTVNVEATSNFYNHGSAFENRGEGTVNGRGYIHCKPHLYGEWHYADAPDEHGNWIRTRTCTICEGENIELVPPNPDEKDVDHIEIVKEPEKTVYEVGDTFSDSGMEVIAILKDGTKADVTKYVLVLMLDGEDEHEIKNGDKMDTEGTGIVVVRYGSLSAWYDVTVMNTPELLSLTGSDGEPAKDLELMPGDQLILNASLKQKLSYKTKFAWESTNESIVNIVPDRTGAQCAVTAAGPGVAAVTVRVTDEDGDPIKAIKARTVTYTVVSHITDIKIVGDDISLDKGADYTFGLAVDPDNTTDTVEWGTSDKRVATVDENGKVTAVGGGEAVITAAAPSGLSDSRKVFVSEKAEDLAVEPEEITMHVGDFDAVSARVSNAQANSDVVWTTSDPQKAVFYVMNEETGKMEYAETVTTTLSADGTGHSDAYALIAGIGTGDAVVTASTVSANGEIIKATCAVKVRTSEKFVYITHNDEKISGEELKLDLAGKYIQLGAVSSEEGDTFKWTTVDDAANPVLKVDGTGKVTFRRKGTAAVKVTSRTTGESDMCLITVILRPEGVVLSDSKVRLRVGDTHRLTAELVPEGAEGTVIWTSSDESIATVSKNGEIKATGVGTAEITAVPDTDGAESTTCVVEVYEEPVVVTLSDKKLMLEIKKKAILTADVTPADAEGTISWKSSDESVVTVTEEGILTGVKAGEADITATFSDPSSKPVSCHVIVYGDDPEPEPHYDPKLTLKLSNDTFTFDGKRHLPKVTVMSGDTVLGEDLTASNDKVFLIYYDSESTAPGTYKVAAVARDLQLGYGEASYDIGIKRTEIKKLVRGRKRFTAFWKRISIKYISGYQIRYSRYKTMRSATVKNVSMLKNWTTIKDLKRGKKYYVQVRTYVKYNGTKYYTSWSGRKSVRCRLI